MDIFVITLPGFFPGEADYLKGLLETGLIKLHIRKPGAEEVPLNALLDRLSGRYASRLVLHGSRKMALRHGIPQIHGSVEYAHREGRSGGGPLIDPTMDPGAGTPVPLAISTSVHSWEEMRALPEGLTYAFISPLFDSISKPGHGANATLLRQPEDQLPCTPIGLGGIGGNTIGILLRMGWKGAAVLGWVWEDPRQAVSKLEQLKKMVDEYH